MVAFAQRSNTELDLPRNWPRTKSALRRKWEVRRLNSGYGSSALSTTISACGAGTTKCDGRSEEPSQGGNPAGRRQQGHDQWSHSEELAICCPPWTM